MSWPNEILGTGYSLLLDYPFSNTLGTGTGVDVGSGCFINNGGLASRITDGTAPESPSFVGQWSYPIGFGDGNAPATFYYGSLGGISDIQYGIEWMMSDPWQCHSSAVNKVTFTFDNSFANNVMIIAYGTSQGALKYSVTLENTTADNSHLSNSQGDPVGTRHTFGLGGGTTVVCGVWHKIWLRLKRSTNISSQDGLIQMWVDGVQTHNYSNVNNPPNNWTEFQVCPVFGGNSGDVKAEQDYQWFDHLRISIPGAGGSSFQSAWARNNNQ